ncbi:MAG: hypothetical protein Q8M76_15855 [Spirochaetaceae bacterium]|nr:hypothetical protein [Spirochaetaceae bacterium]
MKPRLSRALLALGAMGFCAASHALDWPVSQPRIAATFGTPSTARMVTGVLLAAESGSVKVSGPGELVYAIEEGKHPAGLPTSLGSFVVFDHGDGMIAVYAHLAPDPTSRRPREARPGVILGAVGESGWIGGKGMLFQVFDREQGAWINPLLVLPPLADRDAPVIRSVALTRASKSWVLGEARSIIQGRYSIEIDAADRTDAPWTAGPIAPFSIRISVDGIEVAREVFDIAKGSRGSLDFFSLSPKPQTRLRTPDGRYSITEKLFTQGKATVEAIVEDVAGNRRSASWIILVE